MRADFFLSLASFLVRQGKGWFCTPEQFTDEESSDVHFRYSTPHQHQLFTISFSSRLPKRLAPLSVTATVSPMLARPFP
jgi:hypothetical protein